MSHRTERSKVILRDNLLPGFLFRLRASIQGIPDAGSYWPTFQPWRSHRDFRAIHAKVKAHTLLTAERLWTVYSLARQALATRGDFLEAGAYRGGTARLLRHVVEISPGAPVLHVFDTFKGMPITDPKHDLHRESDFADTSLEMVSQFVGTGRVEYHPGLIPDTFRGLEDKRFAFAHIDVDIYKSVRDCCAFIYPRTPAAGVMLFDDYGLPSCPGARAAVDEFFADKPEFPLVLRTGQAIVVKAGNDP